MKRIVHVVNRPGENDDIIHVQDDCQRDGAMSNSFKKRFIRFEINEENDLPDVIGAKRSQAVIPPSDVNWPIPTSRKKIGMPAIMRKMK